MQLCLLLILHDNTACSHLPHLSGVRLTAASTIKHGLAFCSASLTSLERFGNAVQRAAVDNGRWPGHRLFLVDGSGCSMPDTPALQDACGRSTDQRLGCGFPVANLLRLFHAGTGVLLKVVVAPLLTHDLAQGRRSTRPCTQGT